MDIVERLRSRQPYPLDPVGYLINPDGPEAADEIERLRREREIFSQALDDANDWGGELYAENERLREALQFYVSFANALQHENITSRTPNEGTVWTVLAMAVGLAEKALKEKE